MKNFLKIAALLFLNFTFAQNVILNKVESAGNNTDKFLYKIDPDSVKSKYLGEIEVQGFSSDDTAVFDLIYKKAKTIGANAFSYKSFPTVDGISKDIDTSHYLLNLYEVEKSDFSDQSNSIYIISASQKSQKISINNEIVELPPRSFVLKKILAGTIYTISTRKLLGSSVKIILDSYENGQYFQISSFKVNSNSYGKAGINIKSGDISKLEKSYGDFLTVIYSKFKN
ncbi:hypothetical protein [Halpernia frigidisoli]|uniref:Uncharacterized protein n=1 Tax=Halpernia frigidisoli TaxID=1125876 RepID=A0A1I3I7F5_9FLAO|nr:hypothetical protein [Halpernia frigidisoli]SFI43934.1 hypothetical protein SAMN05443292_2605 [Halpernia frigidisoli]